MKFTVTQENFLQGLSVVAHLAGRNATLPILNNVHIKAGNDGIQLMTTNLEIGIRSQVRGKVTEEGEFTVNAKVLYDYMALVNDDRVDVELEHAKGTIPSLGLRIVSGTSRTVIKGSSAEEFPLFPTVTKDSSVSMAFKDLRSALARVVFAASPDESRPELHGILLCLNESTITVAATDSYRLAESSFLLRGGPREGKKIILPIRTAQELLRIDIETPESAQAELFITENQLLFVVGSVEVVSRLVDGTYPDYTQVIPTRSTAKARIDRSALIRAIRSASLFCRSGMNDVRIGFTAGEAISVEAANGQLGEQSSAVSGEVEGEHHDLVLNYRFLLDGLQAMTTPNIGIEVVNSQQPCIIRPLEEKQSYLYLIMPIKQ